MYVVLVAILLWSVWCAPPATADPAGDGATSSQPATPWQQVVPGERLLNGPIFLYRFRHSADFGLANQPILGQFPEALLEKDQKVSFARNVMALEFEYGGRTYAIVMASVGFAQNNSKYSPVDIYRLEDERTGRWSVVGLDLNPLTLSDGSDASNPFASRQPSHMWDLRELPPLANRQHTETLIDWYVNWLITIDGVAGV